MTTHYTYQVNALTHQIQRVWRNNSTSRRWDTSTFQPASCDTCETLISIYTVPPRPHPILLSMTSDKSSPLCEPPAQDCQVRYPCKSVGAPLVECRVSQQMYPPNDPSWILLLKHRRPAMVLTRRHEPASMDEPASCHPVPNRV